MLHIVDSLSLGVKTSGSFSDTSFASESKTDVLVTLYDSEEILRRALLLVRQAQHHLALFGGSQEISALAHELNAASMRGVAVRGVSFGAPPPLQGKVVTYLGQNVSSPTRFLLIVADQAQVLIATYPPNATASAHWADNKTLAILASAFINIEYYFIRMSNEHPAVLQQVLLQVVEPEDRERYARHFHFLEQRIADLQSDYER